jgi:purine-nucleoside phosphorylase
MIYIMVALKAEAQAFVDRFKLPQERQNSELSVVVTGMGSKKMFEGTSEVVKMMHEDDVIINVGICGADKKYEIGQLIDALESKLTCVDHEISTHDHELVDMESRGFFEATKDVKNVYMFKVVSDHFEPKSVTKDMAKKLIFEKIDEIIKRVS